MNTSTLLIILTLAVVSLIDYIPRAFFAFKKAIQVKTGYTRIPSYLIMPTVYGDISYLQNIDFLKKYPGKVLICTSKYESKEFYSDLRKICREYGFRYIKAELPKAKGVPIKNAYTIYKGAFANMKQMRANKNTPCLLMDADTYSESNVNNLMRTFIKEDLDIVSLRCEVAQPKTIIENLQAFEYRLAMDNRKMDPWLTSGACSLARASVYKKVFAKHSNFFAGGDVEIGKLAKIMGYKVRHIDFTFYTAAPDTIKDWYKQRIIWFAGGFRHHVANIASYNWHHFFLFFYNSLLLYLLFPLRWIELVNFPLTLLAAIVLSWLYTWILVYKKGWKPAYLLLPFYAFMQSMFILPIAVGRYLKLAWSQRSLGILKYDLTHLNRSTRLFYGALNVASATIVITAGANFTIARWDYWMLNGSVLNSLF